jgi:precorrin-6B methylase 2
LGETDSSRAFIAADLEQHPGETLLDIGAGTGAWAVFLARYAQHVTALDPSLAMLDVLRENVAAEGLTNVSVVEGSWPDANVPPHDVVLCSHSLYGIADFETAVRKLAATARRRCYLLLRIVTPDSVMAQAARMSGDSPTTAPTSRWGTMHCCNWASSPTWCWKTADCGNRGRTPALTKHWPT